MHDLVHMKNMTYPSFMQHSKTGGNAVSVSKGEAEQADGDL